MNLSAAKWDYLIVTASNDRQAAAYEGQLQLRRQLGFLAEARNVLVVPDPGGRRLGSGGSTVHCLTEVLNRELAEGERADLASWVTALRSLRILIVHAGGDSKRLPAYGPCGKLFVPVPGASDSAVPSTLFDRQVPTYLALPSPPDRGQVVITAGDALVSFDAAEIDFAPEGMTVLGCHTDPDVARRHGVICPGRGREIWRYLQKPTLGQQAERGAIDRYGRTIVDIGIIDFDALTAGALLALCGVAPDPDGRLTASGPIGEAIAEHGMDFYTELCCALGRDTAPADYVAAVRAAGSTWPAETLLGLYEAWHPTRFHVGVVPHCDFLHFGTTRQIISSGAALSRQDLTVARAAEPICVNNDIGGDGAAVGAHAWVEGCRIRSTLELGGDNVVVGLDVEGPLSLPPRACVDVLTGRARDGRDVWFVRCYDVDDTFKPAAGEGDRFCGRALSEWLEAVGASPEEVWDASTPSEDRTAWNARLFPAADEAGSYRQWLWMFDPPRASRDQREAWRQADRYSLAEMAERADHEAFHRRRQRIRAGHIRRSLRRMFRSDSGFSAAELARCLSLAEEPAAAVAELLAEAHWQAGEPVHAAGGAFVSARILHSLGTALTQFAGEADAPLSTLLPGLSDALTPAQTDWLAAIDLAAGGSANARQWAAKAQAAAHRQLQRTIIASVTGASELPRCALRSDEIVWGRAPARLDLGGGWTDTPPYSLEYGGCVINAAVDLNGQPPIHAYARITSDPVIRIASIDLGRKVEITELSDLLSYASATGEFSLVKAALAMSGLSPETAPWAENTSLREMLEAFGGGIELTTLAAIPRGSGLGTSSIMGAVILAVVRRVMGQTLTPRELFHGVLMLEQALTTGGGWQDQIGGAVDGVKVITTEPGLIPDASIHYVPADVLDPRANGGCTLLYYTGLTRLAKNVLKNVVSLMADRDRLAMATLRQLGDLPALVADAMAHKDLHTFGRLVGMNWDLNRQLDPNCAPAEILAIFDRIRPHLCGAKLTGAGGGGFALLVCKSPADARAVREDLEADPPNPRARFFDFDVSRQGLIVTVC